MGKINVLIVLLLINFIGISQEEDYGDLHDPIEFQEDTNLVNLSKKVYIQMIDGYKLIGVLSIILEGDVYKPKNTFIGGIYSNISVDKEIETDKEFRLILMFDDDSFIEQPIFLSNTTIYNNYFKPSEVQVLMTKKLKNVLIIGTSEHGHKYVGLVNNSNSGFLINGVKVL